MKKIRFGVIGTNNISDWVIAGGRQDERFELVAVCSRTQEKASEIATKHNIPHTFTSLEEMAQSPLIDAVYIATPNYVHAQQSILCMSHGKHVLCEKPLAPTVSQIREMFACAKENGVFLMEAFAYLHSPLMAAIKQELESGVIGDVLYMESPETSTHISKTPLLPKYTFVFAAR